MSVTENDYSYGFWTNFSCFHVVWRPSYADKYLNSQKLSKGSLDDVLKAIIQVLTAIQTRNQLAKSIR